VTNGYSKDHRPDLKQFLVKMLCIHHNIPIVGGCESGNTSDKTINNAVLTNLSKYMAKHGLGEGAFVYVADSAMVTPNNLQALGDNLFIKALRWIPPSSAGGRKVEIRRRRIMLLVWSK